MITENRISYEYTSYAESKRKAKAGEAMWGVYKVVRVGVIKTHGQVVTIFPDAYNQPDKKRRKKT